jgi:hypothetical protein
MTAFLMFVLLVLVLVAWGMAHSSQRRLLEATRAERNEWRGVAIVYQEINHSREGLLAEASARAAEADGRARDMAGLMTAGAARIEILEGELARIAEQVRGKCLWPTLGDDEVVVSLDERRAR